MKKQILGIAAIVGALALSSAQATPIDFSGAAEGGNYTYTSQSFNGPEYYIAQGFKFTSAGDEGHFHENFFGDGTVLMHDNTPGDPDTWVLSRVGGGTFDLTSFTTAGGTGTNLHWFTNLNATGGIAADGLNTLNLFGITSLSFSLVNAGAFGGMDQFVVNESTPPAGVPEPASLALLGLGLAGIGFARRKRA